MSYYLINLIIVILKFIKSCGAGLATIGLAGAGIGVSVVVGS